MALAGALVARSCIEEELDRVLGSITLLMLLAFDFRRSDDAFESIPCTLSPIARARFDTVSH